MTITKDSEHFNIKNSLENGWEVSGSMVINSTETTINFYITLPSENSEEMTSSIGNFYWRNNDVNSTNVSYNVNNTDEVEFVTVCLNMIKEILEREDA